MFKNLFTVTFLLLCFSLMVYAQEQNVLKPIGSAYISKDSPHSVIFDKPTKRSTNRLTSHISNPSLVGSVLGKIDTLSYRKSLGGEWSSTAFGFYNGDYFIMWYEAPADLIIKQVGFAAAADSLGGSEVAIKIYKVGNGVTKNNLLNVGPSAVRQGTFKAADPNYKQGYVGFADESADSVYIRGGSTVDNLPVFPFVEDIWSDVGFGYPVTVVPTTDVPVYQLVNTIVLGSEPQVNLGEMFAIVIKHNGPSTITNQTDYVGFWRRDPPGDPSPYVWKFYSDSRSSYPAPPDSSTAYWYSREVMVDFAAVVDLIGDRPPVVANVTSLGTTLSTAPRTITADVTDDNPSGSTPGGVTAVVLQWSTDAGTTWNDVAMTNTSGNTYSGDIPGQSPGANVSFRIKATDDNNGITETLPKLYKIFAKTQDVLFLYNSNNFSGATPQRLYIGYTSGNYIVDPVLNDIWRTPTDGIAEVADVLALYNYVIQVDGSFPRGDVYDQVKAWLDGASSTNKRAYFLSSQDYGCFVQALCADTTFTAGTFQYDYLGVATLGPQDLTFTEGVKVGLVPVASDPLSGWVSTYNSDSSVTFWYDPTFELGFTGYIDAMTPTPSATPIFTRTNGGEVLGVRNEGANWKTAFLAFDYAACNFRSDTSIAEIPGQGYPDPGYNWGVQAGNQALAFLKWAGFVTSIETVNPNVPDKFNLAQNYPNPFNPTTNIRFDIQKTSQVELKVFDILGKEVKTLVNSQLSPGTYNVNFDAATLATGVYFYTIKAGDFVSTKKMMLIK